MTEPARSIAELDPHGLPLRPVGPRPLGPRPLPDRAARHGATPGGTAHTPGTGALSLVPPMTVARPAVATRRPIHVVVAVGITAGLYAVSLAGVSALQSATDTQLAADRAPAADAVAQLKGTHDAMEASLDRLAGAYVRAADGYQAISDGIAGHEQSLGALRKRVGAAASAAAALTIPNLAQPAYRSGGNAVGGGQAAPAVSAPSLARLPVISGVAAAPVSRPVVNACTSASGKPC